MRQRFPLRAPVRGMASSALGRNSHRLRHPKDATGLTPSRRIISLFSCRPLRRDHTPSRSSVAPRSSYLLGRVARATRSWRCSKGSTRGSGAHEMPASGCRSAADGRPVQPELHVIAPSPSDSIAYYSPDTPPDPAMAWMNSDVTVRASPLC